MMTMKPAMKAAMTPTSCAIPGPAWKEPDGSLSAIVRVGDERNGGLELFSTCQKRPSQNNQSNRGWGK